MFAFLINSPQTSITFMGWGRTNMDATVCHVTSLVYNREIRGFQASLVQGIWRVSFLRRGDGKLSGLKDTLCSCPPLLTSS